MGTLLIQTTIQDSRWSNTWVSLPSHLLFLVYSNPATLCPSGSTRCLYIAQGLCNPVCTTFPLLRYFYLINIHYYLVLLSMDFFNDQQGACHFIVRLSCCLNLQLYAFLSPWSGRPHPRRWWNHSRQALLHDCYFMVNNSHQILLWVRNKLFFIILKHRQFVVLCGHSIAKDLPKCVCHFEICLNFVLSNFVLLDCPIPVWFIFLCLIHFPFFRMETCEVRDFDLFTNIWPNIKMSIWDTWDRWYLLV